MSRPFINSTSNNNSCIISPVGTSGKCIHSRSDDVIVFRTSGTNVAIINITLTMIFTMIRLSEIYTYCDGQNNTKLFIKINHVQFAFLT